MTYRGAFLRSFCYKFYSQSFLYELFISLLIATFLSSVRLTSDFYGSLKLIYSVLILHKMQFHFVRFSQLHNWKKKNVSRVFDFKLKFVIDRRSIISGISVGSAPLKYPKTSNFGKKHL